MKYILLTLVALFSVAQISAIINEKDILILQDELLGTAKKYKLQWIEFKKARVDEILEQEKTHIGQWLDWEAKQGHRWNGITLNKEIVNNESLTMLRKVYDMKLKEFEEKSKLWAQFSAKAKKIHDAQEKELKAFGKKLEALEAKALEK